MNGHLFSTLFYVVSFLLGLVVTLVGVMLRQHSSADEDHRRRYDKEIDTLRRMLHDLEIRLQEKR